MMEGRTDDQKEIIWRATRNGLAGRMWPAGRGLRTPAVSVDQPYMAPGTALFTALKKSQKLLRLSIICHRDMLPMDLLALEQLIQALPSLILLAVMSISTPQVAFNKLIGKLKKM
ncbi:hypothetical protein GWK47_020914 [Chionoecetes opilio]|uniref:Uncharacterized protein n=1 Tax=Chionoecetes opilio TaxID=41210 RepID=A0A8J4XNW4_CHIOP|nr:hypothetical protein GWK47_020914 [Chionoecetes opilio]